MFLILIILKVIFAEQQQTINNYATSSSTNVYGPHITNPNKFFLQQPQSFVTQSPFESMFTLFPTINTIYFPTMSFFRQQQGYANDFVTNTSPLSNNNFNSIRNQTNVEQKPYVYNYTFAPGTLPTYCGYRVYPIPVYNTPYKKCIPNNPGCGLFFTCIMDANKRSKVLGQSAN